MYSNGRLTSLATILLGCFMMIAPMRAQLVNDTFRSWNEPIPPFNIIDNVYYVGVKGISAFLITTPAGYILLDGGFKESVPYIRKSMEELGFYFNDIKIILNSHAHADHAGGIAEIRRITGAQVVISEGDATLISNGGRGDLQWDDDLPFDPVVPDRIITDGDTVTLGGITLTARITAGHTKGCTTWLMKVQDGEKTRDVVFLGSLTAPDYKLVNNEKYPDIISDYLATFRLLKNLQCDVYLSAHSGFFKLHEKRENLANNPVINPFIDPAGFRESVHKAEMKFHQQLAEQQEGNPESTKKAN